MKIICMTLLSLLPFLTNAQDIIEIRKQYLESVEDESKCNALYNRLMIQKNNRNQIFLGYKGAVAILMAKFVGNPFTKLSYFKEGKAILENAIEKAPQEIELHFLRFGIQENLPAILRYNENMKEDKSFMIQHLQEVDSPQFRQVIISILLKSSHVSEEEKSRLRNLNSK